MVIFGKDKEMKRNYVTILVLAIGVTVLLCGALPCGAEEKEEESVWQEDEPKGRGFRRFELTDEAIERMMSRLAESDPAQAKELAKLRESDAEKFKAELRKVMRERFGQRWREQRDQKAGQKFRPGQAEGGERRGPGAAGRRGTGRMMRERHGEFLEWLKKDYPKVAEELAELRDKKPELFERKLEIIIRIYRRIFEASKESPKLVKVLKEDLQLKKHRNELLTKIRTTKDADKKKELMKELGDVVNNRYDLIVRRKQIEYENLLTKLEKLKEQVKKSKTAVERWDDAGFKNESVKARLEELVSKTGKFRWD